MINFTLGYEGCEHNNIRIMATCEDCGEEMDILVSPCYVLELGGKYKFDCTCGAKCSIVVNEYDDEDCLNCEPPAPVKQN